ncbi:hypothetical protein RB595_007618 [Gaeumannomyces hyphopodioides]
MCYALGCPSVFLTFSAADLHWHSVAKVMPRYHEWLQADDAGKQRIARNNLRDHAQVAAYHFHRRFKHFFNEYLLKKFKFEAHWFRYEWQGRGSPHIHGLFWVPTAPDVSLMNTSEGQAHFASWGLHITAVNIEPGRAPVPGEDNPFKYDIGVGANDLQPSFQTLSRITNRVQRHQCTQAKYVSKAETQTVPFKEMMKGLLPKVSHTRPLVSLVAKMMNKLVAERDWSAMEVCHHQLGLPLVVVSHVFQLVDCRPFDPEKVRMVSAERNEVIEIRKLYQKYLEREGWPELTYFDFLTKMDHQRSPWRFFGRNARPQILNYFPRYKRAASENNPEREGYRRVKLMLHHPHTSVAQVGTVLSQEFDEYSDAYAHCQAHCPEHPEDYYTRIDEFEDDPEAANNQDITRADWTLLAGELLRQGPEVEDIEIIGNREIDINKDWLPHVGKTFVLNLICASLRAFNTARGVDREIVRRAAPTGVAANAINGVIIHSLLRLPIRTHANSPMEDLPPQNAAEIRAGLKDVEYIFPDEKSMIGVVTLNLIDRPMRQIFEEHNLPFGGRNVVLIGDFFQLSPIMQKALFSPGQKLRTVPEKAGRVAYLQFNRTVELTQLMRQGGDDEEARSFRDALEGLRNNNPTRRNWEVLSCRVRTALPHPEVVSFDRAVRIYPTNAQVKEYNFTHLEHLNEPVIQVLAQNTGSGGAAVESRDAGNLHNSLPLCIGARVMLTDNVWTKAGLVNGASGHVYDLTWAPGVVDPRQEPPFLLLMQVDKYDSPPCFPDEPTIPPNIVPIFRVSRDFLKSNTACNGVQFPVTVSYAITVHKSQGMTLDKAVMGISGKDFQSGLTYVADYERRRRQGQIMRPAVEEPGSAVEEYEEDPEVDELIDRLGRSSPFKSQTQQ